MSLRQVQDFVARQIRGDGGSPNGSHPHGLVWLRRRLNRDLRRAETGRQPGPDRRAPFSRFSRDQRLENGADARPGRVAVTTLLEGPPARRHADDHIRRRRDALFGDEEVQLPGAGVSEAGGQPFPRDGVLHEARVAVEPESIRFGAQPSHRHHGGQIAVRPAPDHRHRCAVARRLVDRHERLRHWNGHEPVGVIAVLRPRERKEHVRTERRVVAGNPVDEHAVVSWIRRAAVESHPTDAADLQWASIEHRVQVVTPRARQHVVLVGQREQLLVTAPPVGACQSRVKCHVSSDAERLGMQRRRQTKNPVAEVTLCNH